MTIAPLDPECIVVGAGIFGSAMAFALARDGRRVLLIERDLSEPDRIVGELLQPGGIAALTKLGLAGCLKGIDAITNSGYGVIYGERNVKLDYPVVDEESGERAKGCSFHHGKFIMKLREACASRPEITIEEATVNKLVESEDGIVTGVLCTKKGPTAAEIMKVQFDAPLVIVADGCFSKFRKELSQNNTVLVRSHFVGAVLKDCPLPFPGNGHVVLAKPSPILLYQIGTHDTRVLVDIPGKLPSASSGALKDHLLSYVLPQLPRQVQASFEEAVSEQRLRVMPNSYLPAVSNDRRGLLILGDALNMRHPLTGGGMTVAFNDANLLSHLLSRQNVPNFGQHDIIQQQMLVFSTERKRHSTVINVLAQALYELFSAGADWRMAVLREACFKYFELGGICADHPMGLLSGVRKNPVHLYLHFFAVAFYGLFQLLISPTYPLDFIVKSSRVSHDPVLRVLNVIIYSLATILSLPLNLIYGVIVVYSASLVIFPLIWAEIKA